MYWYLLCGIFLEEQKELQRADHHQRAPHNIGAKALLVPVLMCIKRATISKIWTRVIVSTKKIQVLHRSEYSYIHALFTGTGTVQRAYSIPTSSMHGLSVVI